MRRPAFGAVGVPEVFRGEVRSVFGGGSRLGSGAGEGSGNPQMRELAHGEAAPPGCWGAKQCQVRRLGAVVPRSVCEVGVG